MDPEGLDEVAREMRAGMSLSWTLSSFGGTRQLLVTAAIHPSKGSEIDELK
jgi:hypothetical protein